MCSRRQVQAETLYKNMNDIKKSHWLSESKSDILTIRVHSWMTTDNFNLKVNNSNGQDSSLKFIYIHYELTCESNGDVDSGYY